MSTTPQNDVEAWLDSLDPATMNWRDGAPLRAIGAALTNLEAAEEGLVDSIRAARRAGESWGMIGMVLGTSRQAAHRKYADLVRDEEPSPES